MKTKAVVFDLDDTLVRPNDEFELKFTKKCLETFTRTTFTDEQISEYLSKPIPEREAYLKALGFRDKQEYLDMWLTPEAIAERANNLFVFPDTKTLSALKRAGMKLGLVTSSPDEVRTQFVFRLEQYLGQKDIFDCEVSIFGTRIPRKPDPRALLDCLAIMHVTPNSALYCGNEIDVEMARRAQVKPVLIDRKQNTNFSSSPIVINNLYDVVTLLGRD